jgi:hypothetical protein
MIAKSFNKFFGICSLAGIFEQYRDTECATPVKIQPSHPTEVADIFNHMFLFKQLSSNFLQNAKKIFKFVAV